MRFRCHDCQVPTWNEYYHVHNSLWDEHAGAANQLCILCLEKRVGRRLTRRDFTLKTPINRYPLIRTAVLRSRLWVPQGFIDMRIGLYVLDWAANNWIIKAYEVDSGLSLRDPPAVPESEVEQVLFPVTLSL